MSDISERSVSLTRESLGIYVATNATGATLRFGAADDETFSPVELLLAAVAGCSAIDVDHMTSRRATPLVFEATSSATQEKGDDGNILRDIVVSFHLKFPEGDEGDKARDRIGAALTLAHDKTCTVGRTLEAGAAVTLLQANAHA